MRATGSPAPRSSRPGRTGYGEAAARVVRYDPDCVWDDAFEGEDSLPDHAALRAAAETLARTSPWLARPRGPLPGQGQHSTGEQPVSLSSLLRS